MRTTVTGATDRTAEQIRAADESLRTSFAGLAVDQVLPEVRRSATEIGLTLGDDELRTWAQRISDRADHEISLG